MSENNRYNVAVPKNVEKNDSEDKTKVITETITNEVEQG